MILLQIFLFTNFQQKFVKMVRFD